MTRPDPLQNQAKVLKLLWAVGQSRPPLAALFEEHYIKMASDSSFRQRCQVLGQEAAAAMDAECAAAMRKSDYALVDRLHQIARTSPAVLQAAGELIADPQNSMADGVLAGVLLAAAPEEKTGLLRAADRRSLRRKTGQAGHIPGAAGGDCPGVGQWDRPQRRVLRTVRRGC